MLTGLEPPEHGIHDNGTAALPPDVPTLATVLKSRGYNTGAFVASRVLDRRFGLARGFDAYDDSMAAEELGEYGYPERDAVAVTNAALAWASKQNAAKPLFLWVHYYDPHSPYRGSYAAEVALVDREVGRLLGGLRKTKRVVVVAGDHGEALGEHGERTHGVFLYRSVLEVPLFIAGAGAARVVSDAVSTKRIAPTIAHLLGIKAFGVPLPPFANARPPVYSETHLPSTAYGWSVLRAYSDDRLRYIEAPRVELYDYVSDPAEARNLASDRRRDLFRLKNALAATLKSMKQRDASTKTDPALAASLRSLGYLSGATRGRGSNLDPKDGIVLLEEMEAIREQIGAPNAATRAEALVKKSPGNVPFLTLAGEAWLAAGDPKRAIGAYREAAALNPSLDFLHVNLGDAHRAAGDAAGAEREYRLALQLNPRLASAALKLADLKPAEARAILRASVNAGSSSATVLTRLAVLDEPVADALLAEAVRVAPKWSPAWVKIAERADARGDRAAARDAWRRAAAHAPRDPRPLLGLAQSYLATGERQAAKTYLERVVALAPRSGEARQARALLR